MKTTRGFKSMDEANEARDMAKYILTILTGTSKEFTERKRQFFTWGAEQLMPIVATDGSIGLQMKVNGLKHKGRVRIWYNYGPDLFSTEFIRPRKEEAVKEVEDIYLEDLQWICHSNIERDDDMRL